MKKTLLTLTFVAASVAAFAQGKISMLNDAAHAVTWGNASVLKSSDAALAGTAVSASTQSGSSLIVELWGGTSAGTMSLQATQPISAADGLFGPFNFISANLPGAVVATMQIQIRETGFATAGEAQSGGGYFGFSPIFTFKPSSTIAYNSIINSGGTALSTWAPGQVVVGIAPVPEPTTFALAGLGSAALLIFRRRNK